MISCFVLHTKEDAACGEEIRMGLEKLGYRCWREPTTLTLDAMLYPHTVENGVLGSAVVILIWSSTAAGSEWIERLLLFAQRLRKQIIPLLLDETALPTTLVTSAVIHVQGSCAGSVQQLQAMLPAADDADPLFALTERAAHSYLRERKAAIEQASELLQQHSQQGPHSEERREAVLALLEYLAQHDTMDGVRMKAKEAIEATITGTPGLAGLEVTDTRHSFGVRCKNGHISYFDKRQVCKASFEVPRGLSQRAGKKLDELLLTCSTCGVQVIAYVDCEDYR